MIHKFFDISNFKSRFLNQTRISVKSIKKGKTPEKFLENYICGPYKNWKV